MINLYAFAAYVGAIIAAGGSAMSGLSLLSTLGYAVPGADIRMFVLPWIAFIVCS